MDRVIGFLNNKYLLAAIAGLFLLGLFRRFAGR